MCQPRCSRLPTSKLKAKKLFAGKKRAQTTKPSLKRMARNGALSSMRTGKCWASTTRARKRAKKARNINRSVAVLERTNSLQDAANLRTALTRADFIGVVGNCRVRQNI